MLFARGDALFVTREDGGGLVQVTPDPLVGLSEWGFSPDGRSVVALARVGQGIEIVVADSDGRGQPRHYPVFATEGDGPPQYRPDGSDIMFIGKEPQELYRGVYELDPVTTNVRKVVAPSPTIDIHGASWSPDGKHVAYGVVDPRLETGKTHVVGVDGTGDVAIDTSPDSISDGGFAWSNDGTRLIVTRFYKGDGTIPARSVILPIDLSSTGIEIECVPGAPADDCSADWTWSPDDSTLLGSLDRADGTTAQFLADPRTGQVSIAPWTAAGHPSWQRVAR